MAQEEYMTPLKRPSQKDDPLPPLSDITGDPDDDLEDKEVSTEDDDGDDDLDLEIVDDTPEEDRGREPMPDDIVKELENDELDDVDAKTKERMKRYKKVWHDERRRAEQRERELNAALEHARRLQSDNERMRHTMSDGERALVNSVQQTAQYQLDAAKAAYVKAHEEADADAMATAQEQISIAANRLQQAKNYRPTLQQQPNTVNQQEQQVQRPAVDEKAKAWQERNTWYNVDPEMTATAMGVHQKLVREKGPQYAGTDAYWQEIDKTMSRRYPEYFDGDEGDTPKPEKKPRKQKPTVVAPASRSTSSKRVVLTKSELAIARRLGLTEKQYAQAKVRLEKKG